MRCAHEGLGGEVRHMRADARAPPRRRPRPAAAPSARSSSRWCSAGPSRASPICCWSRAPTASTRRPSPSRIGEALERPDATVRARASPALPSAASRRSATTRPLATFMDEALLAYAVVWAAAGTPDARVPIAPAQLAEAHRRHRHPRRLSRGSLPVPALAQERPQDVGIVVGPRLQAAVVEFADLLERAERLERLARSWRTAPPSRSTAHSCRRPCRRR